MNYLLEDAYEKLFFPQVFDFEWNRNVIGYSKSILKNWKSFSVDFEFWNYDIIFGSCRLKENNN